MGRDVGPWLGGVSLYQTFMGFGLCAGVGIGLMLFAGMGGGDVKLLAALGALLGLTVVLQLMLWALLIAVPYALVNLLIRGRLNGIVRLAAAQLMDIVYLRRLEPVSAPSQTRIPMALPMLIAMFAMHCSPLTQWVGTI